MRREGKTSVSLDQGTTPLPVGSTVREVGRMQMFGNRSPVTAADKARLAEELAEIGMAIGVAERACCCPARPVVRAVMPATARRPEPVDLLLCGHHYRAGRAALLAAGAAVYDERGVLFAGSPAGRRLWLHKTAVPART